MKFSTVSSIFIPRLISEISSVAPGPIIWGPQNLVIFIFGDDLNETLRISLGLTPTAGLKWKTSYFDGKPLGQGRFFAQAYAGHFRMTIGATRNDFVIDGLEFRLCVDSVFAFNGFRRANTFHRSYVSQGRAGNTITDGVDIF